MGRFVDRKRSTFWEWHHRKQQWFLLPRGRNRQGLKRRSRIVCRRFFVARKKTTTTRRRVWQACEWQSFGFQRMTPVIENDVSAQKRANEFVHETQQCQQVSKEVVAIDSGQYRLSSCHRDTSTNRSLLFSHNSPLSLTR